MQAKLGTIAFIPDDRLSRERSAILSRAINTLRHYAKIEILPASTNEQELISKLEKTSYHLVLVPWYRYLAWSKVEAFYGLTRNSGPTFAGYFGEAVQPYEIGEQAEHLRSILFDFCYLQTSEIVLLLKAILDEKTRSGIRSLVDVHAPIYVENWYSRQGQGTRADAILSLPELGKTAWKKRTSAIRICLSALWSLVYEEGPGKSESSQSLQKDIPKAYFQVAADAHCLVLRLIYNMSGWTIKNTLTSFWHNPASPINPGQFLLRYSDFLKVHTIVETNDIEIVVGFFESAPSEKAFGKIHTQWIEPLSAGLVTELPFENPSPQSPRLKQLPTLIPMTELKQQAKIDPHQSAKDRFILEASQRIRKLTQELGEKEQIIREFKNGGVGSVKGMSKLDPEGLLSAFQEQYFQTKLEIKDLEDQYQYLQNNEHTSEQLQELNTKINALLQREKDWIKQLLVVLETFRASKKQVKTG